MDVKWPHSSRTSGTLSSWTSRHPSRGTSCHSSGWTVHHRPGGAAVHSRSSRRFNHHVCGHYLLVRKTYRYCTPVWDRFYHFLKSVIYVHINKLFYSSLIINFIVCFKYFFVAARKHNTKRNKTCFILYSCNSPPIKSRVKKKFRISFVHYVLLFYQT